MQREEPAAAKAVDGGCRLAGTAHVNQAARQLEAVRLAEGQVMDASWNAHEYPAATQWSDWFLRSPPGASTGCPSPSPQNAIAWIKIVPILRRVVLTVNTRSGAHATLARRVGLSVFVSAVADGAEEVV